MAFPNGPVGQRKSVPVQAGGLRRQGEHLSPRQARRLQLHDGRGFSDLPRGRGFGVVGYNVQVAVETKHHLIVTHEVTNTGSDRAQLANIAKQAKAVLQADRLKAVAEHPFGTIKARMGATHFLTKTLPKVAPRTKFNGENEFDVFRQKGTGPEEDQRTHHGRD